MPKHNKNQYSLKEAYNFYKSEVSDPVSYKEYKLILDTWGNIVIEYLIQGKDVLLHRGLSLLGVRKKTKLAYVDKQESKRQKKKVLVSNSHSGFYGASVYWRRHYTRFSSVGWSFKASRVLSRKLAAIMQESGGHTNFISTSQAVSADKPEQAKAMYKKKVLKL